MKKKAKELTTDELKWAANLKAIFLRKQATDETLTQASLAERLGISQSAVGQYMNAKIPLNTDAKIAFAIALPCDVTEIDEKFLTFLPQSEEEKIAAQTVRILNDNHDVGGLQAFLEFADLLRQRHEALSQPHSSAAAHPETSPSSEK